MENGENREPEPHDKNEDAEPNLNGKPEGGLENEKAFEELIPDIELPETENQPESPEETDKESPSEGGGLDELKGIERNVEDLSEKDIENAVPDVEFPENEHLHPEAPEEEPSSDEGGEGEPEVREEDIENAVPDVEFPEDGDQLESSEEMEEELYSEGEPEGDLTEPVEWPGWEPEVEREEEPFSDEGFGNHYEDVPEIPPLIRLHMEGEGEKGIRDGFGKEVDKGESRHVEELREREADISKLMKDMLRDEVEGDVRKEIENKLRENLRESGFGKKEIDKIVEKVIRETVEERLNELLGRTTSGEVHSDSRSYGDTSFTNAFLGALNFLVEGMLSVFGKVFSSVEKLGKTHSPQSGSHSQDRAEQKFQGWSSEKQGTFKAERQGGEQWRLNTTERRAEKVETKKPVNEGARVEPHKEERHNMEKTFKPGVEVSFSARTGLMKTPEGGRKQYVTDSTRVQDELTRTSFEKTHTVSHGETPEGVRVKEFTGNSEAHNIRVRIPIDGKQFETFWFNIRSLEQFSRMETERPMEVSLRKELKGDNIKTKVWFHSDSRLKDLREMGVIRERWRDVNGVEYARIGRWMVFSFKVEGRNVAIGCIDVKEVGAGREGIDRSPDFKWFNPLPREPFGGMRGGESKTSIKYNSETGGTTQWMERLLRGDNTQKYDYKAKLDITELRYSSSGEAGNAAKAAETSGVAESVEKLFEQKTAEAEGKTETTLEMNAGTPSASETSKEVGEKSVHDINIEKNANASNIIRTPEIPAEKKVETSNSSGIVKTADWADGGKRFISVDFGEGAGVKGVPVEGVLRAFADRVFEAGGENEYYEKLLEKGIWLDGEKLNEMLFVKREIPVEVYGALVPLEEHTHRKISDAESHLETKSEEDYWRDRMREAGLEPLADREKQLEQFDKVAVMEKHIQEITENQNEPKTRPIHAIKIIDSETPHTDAEKPEKKKKKTEKETVNDSEIKKTDETPSEEKTTTETIEEENEWLNTLNYEKPTVLIFGKIYNFTLFSKDIMSKVKEAKNDSKSEGNLTVQATCYEAIKQFKEEQCIDLYHLLTIARYLRKSEEETSPPDEETEMIQDIYSSELVAIEELLKLLGAEYRKTQEGIEVREALEPYEWVEIPKEHIDDIIKNIQSNKNLGDITKLYDKLNKMGLTDLKYHTLTYNFRHKFMSLDIYLRICNILGIEKDINLVTNWRRLNVENVGKAEGEWYNNFDIKVRIHPEDLRKLYTELENKLEEEKISLDKFAASLSEAGSTISRVSHLSEILDRKFVDTIALLEICDFLGRDPKTLRELDHNSLPATEKVSLSRKVIRLLRSETIKKYKQFSQLAKKINETPYSVNEYLSGERGIPVGILKKIEKVLDLEVKDSLHRRKKVVGRDYSRETIGKGGDEWEVMIEKIEIKDTDGVKIPLLTFIHKRDKEGGIYTEIPQTGETAESTPTPWWLSSPNTSITIDRTKEFREGEDLLTYIIEKCVDKAGSAGKASKIHGMSGDALKRLLKDKENDTVTLRTLLALAMYSDEIKKLSELTYYIERAGIIERKHNPDLTIDWNNPEGAHIILNLHGDGGFQKRRKWAYVIDYSNSQIDLINTFVDKIEKVCGIIPIIIRQRGIYYRVKIVSNLVGISLFRAGVKPGKKTIINPQIPKFIIEGSTHIRKSASKAIIADEGGMEPDPPRLMIRNNIDTSELEQHRNMLSQIDGIIRSTPRRGSVYKSIAIGKLKDYKEILTIVNNKQSNILQGVRDIIGSLLKEHGMKLERKDLKIRTVGILVYSNRISIIKHLTLSVEATWKLRQILGGFPGYKELMYMNYASVFRSIPNITLRLSENEVEILKKIGTRRIQHGKEYYFVPVDKLPEGLKQYANPPDDILKMQKEYSEEEIEILIEGNPVKVKGMPSRISGEIILGPNENVASWRLVHALVGDIKKKWESEKHI